MTTEPRGAEERRRTTQPPGPEERRRTIQPPGAEERGRSDTHSPDAPPPSRDDRGPDAERRSTAEHGGTGGSATTRGAHDRPRDPDEAQPFPEPRRLLAEVVGSFTLVAVAAGGDAAARTSGEVTDMARAVAPGLLVMALVYALGDVSGAHFNPAVTVGFTLKRLFPVRWLVMYWLAQLAGSLLAAAGLGALFGDTAHAGVSTPHVPAAEALAIEAFLSFVLLTVVLGTADRHRLIGPNAAIAVGATISLCGLIALPLTGASMNPARSTGPAIAAGELGNLWIYWVGPMLGSVLAVAFTAAVHGGTPTDEDQVEAAAGKPPQDQPGAEGTS